MSHFEDALRESRTRPDRESEAMITPEHSAETLRMVEQIDDRIADSENLLGGLGRMARERIITDPKALEEIYAPKEIGRMDLKGEHDALALETASKGLKIKHAILGWLGGGKHALQGDEGLVDKRKLREEAEGNRYGVTEWTGELEEVAKNFGLDPEKINPRDFSKIYVEGKRGKGAEKIILKEKTNEEIEQEKDKLAGKIFTKQLKDLETAGADLIKQKQGLEDFQKEKEQHKSILDETSLAKLENEAIGRQGFIGDEQENLNSKLDNIRLPLLEQRENLAQALEGFSALLKEVDGQEKIYLNEIKDLQNKITKISGAKQLKEVLGDEIKEWEQEKKQAEANLKDFKEKKDALNKRIIALKKNQAEVDATLTGINSLGKTPAELKTEKAEKEEQKERSKEQRSKNDTRRLDISSEGQEKTALTAGESGLGQSRYGKRRVESFGKLDLKEKIEREEEKTALAAEATPAEKTALNKKPVKNPAMPKPEKNQPASPMRIEHKDKEPIIKTVSQWLKLLEIHPSGENENDLVKKHFAIGVDAVPAMLKEFHQGAMMGLTAARNSYKGYLREFEKLNVKQAKDKTNKKFFAILQELENKNLD